MHARYYTTHFDTFTRLWTANFEAGKYVLGSLRYVDLPRHPEQGSDWSIYDLFTFKE